ncbi:hypothetical protein [Salininema proteolyticum]|uniref:Uncharacterized protein n=1 Tax=Salininema proteolyticum TaxID=1607685 RepID=A0ABV8U1V4_9ACTN
MIETISRNRAAVTTLATSLLLLVVVGTASFQTWLHARIGYLTPIAALGEPRSVPGLRFSPMGHQMTAHMVVDGLLALAVAVALAAWAKGYGEKRPEAGSLRFAWGITRITMLLFAAANTVRVTVYGFQAETPGTLYLLQVGASWVLAVVYGLVVGTIIGAVASAVRRTGRERREAPAG